MEQVIKEQVKKECDKICVCIYEETKGSIRIYPYSQIVSSRLIVAIDTIKKEYAEMIDYYISYDGLKREIYISVDVTHYNPFILDVWFNPKKGFSYQFYLIGGSDEMNYDEENKQIALGLGTSIEVYNAIGWIADLDNYSAKKLWENGYTDKHSYDKVEELIKQYIRENIPEDEIDSIYYWGDGDPIVMYEE